jgi:DNA-binding NarL/FixJ family response regulator
LHLQNRKGVILHKIKVTDGEQEMGPIRIFIISDSLTFSNGLKGLLLSEPEMEIITQETDVNRAIDQIEELKPDVIIWANTGIKRDAAGEEMHLLQATPDIRTVSLNLQNNDITVHQATQKTIRVAQDVQDLITAIKDSLFPNPSSLVEVLPIG